MCKGQNEKEIVTIAAVGEKKLMNKDLAEVIPDNLDENDSILMANDYIKKWIQKELLLQKAEENLTPEQKNVNKELQEYRNSLLIYKYKNELLKQRMDTTVSTQQIQDYYDSNKDNFNLNKNIVKAIFIKIPNDFANREELKLFSDDTSEEGLAELRDYCVQYAKVFDIFIDYWVEFDVLQKNLPQEINAPEDYISKNKWIEMNDSTYYYLVSIHDFRLKNQIAPVEYVEKNIKNLILNQRKIEFLKNIEKNVYTEGIRKNRFKIYKQKTDETNN
jgi:hypothetical protein